MDHINLLSIHRRRSSLLASLHLTPNSRTLVPHRDKTVAKVGADVCSLLPAMRVLMGCDFTSSLEWH